MLMLAVICLQIYSVTLPRLFFFFSMIHSIGWSHLFIYFFQSRYTVNPRLQQACRIYRGICGVLLSSYESLQASYEALNAKLPPYQQIKIGKDLLLVDSEFWILAKDSGLTVICWLFIEEI